MMEEWNDGRMAKKSGRMEGDTEGWVFPNLPSFQSSIIPLFRSSILPSFHPSIIPIRIAGNPGGL